MWIILLVCASMVLVYFSIRVLNNRKSSVDKYEGRENRHDERMERLRKSYKAPPTKVGLEQDVDSKKEITPSLKSEMDKIRNKLSLFDFD